MDSFYPFLNGDANTEGLTEPSTPARIAIYDDMTIAPRVVSIEPSDIRTYLEEITQAVYTLSSQQGTDWPFTLIRELVENYIHASFLEPTVSILDKGQTLIFSDSGPGIPNKEDAIRPSFTSATSAMKQYIRGVGSGLPTVEGQMKLKHGSLRIEDNVGRGTVITVSLKQQGTAEQQPPAQQPYQNTIQQSVPLVQQQPPAQQPYNQYPAQPYQNGYQQTSQQYSQDVLYRYDPTLGFIPVAPQNYQLASQHQAVQTPPQQQQITQPLPYPLPQPYQQPSQPAWNTPQQNVISPDQREIISLFSYYDSIGPKELTKHLSLSSASCSRKLKDLSQLGYIVKTGQKYTLTQDGKLLLRIIMNER